MIRHIAFSSQPPSASLTNSNTPFEMPDHHNIHEAKDQDFSHQNIDNEAAKGISYYTPAQHPPAGTASDPQPDGSHPPKLFQSLKLRGLTLQNRIMVRLLRPRALRATANEISRSPHCANTPQRTAITPPGISRTWAASSSEGPG